MASWLACWSLRTRATSQTAVWAITLTAECQRYASHFMTTARHCLRGRSRWVSCHCLMKIRWSKRSRTAPRWRRWRFMTTYLITLVEFTSIPSLTSMERMQSKSLDTVLKMARISELSRTRGNTSEVKTAISEFSGIPASATSRTVSSLSFSVKCHPRIQTPSTALVFLAAKSLIIVAAMSANRSITSRKTVIVRTSAMQGRIRAGRVRLPIRPECAMH